MASTDPGKISPKVVASTVAAFATLAALAALNYLVTPDGQQLFASLPPALSGLVVAVATALATALAGYVKADRARTGISNDNSGMGPDLPPVDNLTTDASDPAASPEPPVGA